MCFQLLKLVGEKMNIKEIDYKENAKISAEMLDKYTKTRSLKHWIYYAKK